MENKKIASIKKASKTTSTVLRVCEWILGICFVICIAAVIICGIFKSNINSIYNDPQSGMIFDDNFVAQFKSGVLNYTVPFDELVDNGDFTAVIIVCLVAGAISLAIAFVVVELLRSVFATMYKNDTPFNPITLKKIKVLGIISTIMTVLFTSVAYGVIVALATWCMYCVFDYGIELQKESDETL